MSTFKPDILARNLDVVFCGINPAASAVIAGHNFSNRSNRFWRVLHLAGFTDLRLEAARERSLLKYGCGITAVVDRPTQRASEVFLEEFRRARPTFEAKIRRYAPRCVAFLGKRAFSAMHDEPTVGWGRRPTRFGGAIAWILPNPSGLNRSFSLGALVKAYCELRIALAESIGKDTLVRDDLRDRGLSG